MGIYLSKVIQALLLPPGLIIAVVVAGYLLARRFPRLGKLTVFCGFVLLLLLSLPVVAHFNTRLLEADGALTQADMYPPRAQAIVILSGGKTIRAPEYHGEDTVSRHTLERIRYGAWLHRSMNLPMLVTGGNVYESGTAGEAQLMQDVLQREFHLPVRWVESGSRNTWENARFTSEVLREEGIDRVYLVTQAYHMARARMAFEANGLEVVPAPTGFMRQGGEAFLFTDCLPSISAFRASHLFLHEVLGVVWYKLRHELSCM